MHRSLSTALARRAPRGPGRGLAGAAVAALALGAPARAAEITLDDVRIAPGTSEAVARHVPWSGAWWPMQSGKLAKGWNGTADDFTYDAATEDFTQVTGKADDDLSPLAKYDLFVKRRHGADPRSAYTELKGDDAIDFHHHVYGRQKEEYDRDGVSYGWWGHCNGWAAAAVMEREPLGALTAEGIRFDVADLKGMLSEVYWAVRSDFTGRRYNKPSPELRAKVERGAVLLEKLGAADMPPVADYIAWYEDIYSTTIAASVRPTLRQESFRSSLESVRDWAKQNWDEAYKDIYPHVFHKLLVSCIQNRRVALVFDTSANEEVWNFPCYWFSTDVRFKEDLPSGGKRYAVTTQVKYAHDGVSESIVGINDLPETYTYDLDCDSQGRPTGGEWTGRSVDEHPDFAWLPTFKPLGSDTGTNPKIELGKVAEILQLDHTHGDWKLELAARSRAGDIVRRSAQLGAQSHHTTTWDAPVAVSSPVTVQAFPLSGSGIAKVVYWKNRLVQGSGFPTAQRGLPERLGESTDAAASFEKSFALPNGKAMLLAHGLDASGRLVSVAEITVNVGGTPAPAQDDAFEQNDTRDAAKLVAAGSHPNLRCEDDDWYKVAVAAGQTLAVTIAFSHAEGDLDLTVHSASSQIGSSAGTGNTETVRGQALAAGTYFIRVFGYSGAKAAYSMTVGLEGGTTPTPTPDPTPTPTPDPTPTPSDDDAFEPNDTKAEAKVIAAGTHAMKVRDDDWFKLDLASGQRVTFGLAFSHAAGDIDMKLESATGTSLGSSTGSTNSESIAWTATAAGTVFLRVYGYNGARNDVTLTVAITGGTTPTPTPDPTPTPQPANDDAFEPNDSRAAARAIAAGTHALQVRNDDWFKLDLASGQTLTLTLTFRHADGDVDVRLQNASGAQVGAAESANDNEALSYTASAAGTYYVRVFGYNGAVNPTVSMTIALSGGASPAPTPSPATRTGVVTASALNVRSGPGVTYPSVRTIAQNTTVTILEEQGTWYRVTFAGAPAGNLWVSKTYIRLNP